jgi:prolyl 4-hydroxylase
MIKIIDDVLNEIECNQLIELGSKQLIEAKTLGKEIEGYRTAENSWIFEENELTEKIKNIVNKETGLPIENQENIHIVKYNIGGEYKSHHDFFHPNTDYYESSMGNAGQRVYSCIFYLNDNFIGGGTEFTNKNIKINPKIGRLLIWRNLYESGKLDYDSMHAGLPVEEGEKWIAIVWVRENSFKSKITPISIDFGKIMEESECEKIKELFLNGIDDGQIHLETDTKYYNNSYGGVLPVLWEYLEKYKNLVEEKINKKVKNANPYIRIYKKGSTLNLHKDRVGLDYTISICIFENINKDWNLKVNNNQTIEFITKIGHASLVTGSILEHWREPLDCNENQFVIQLFLHYTDI